MLKILTNSVMLLVLCLFSFIGCKTNKTTSDATTTPAPVSPTTPTPGVIDAAGGFNIKVNPPQSTNYYIHKTGDFDKYCVIASDATAYADRDIECIVEVEELEGLFHGIDMVLNVPPEMCKYVVYSPYFYFGKNYGVGPTAATVRFDVNGTYVSGSVTGAGSISPTGEVNCNYDYSAAEGPNCCYGTYDKTTVTNFGSTDLVQFPVTTTVETGLTWTGLPGNCVAGVGDKSERNLITNMPLSTIYFEPNGYSQTFSTGESLKKGVGSLYYANYFSGATPTAFKMAATYPGNPYYEWACLDEADELKYRIRVLVREWNEMSQFVLKAAGNPDTTGTETDWLTPINDLADWLDVGGAYPGMPAN